MNRFRNHLIAAAVLSVLGVIGTVMNSHQAAAQPGPPNGVAVNIVNPLPVPVTGSTTVSGTVAATQSGAWNVGITGTPNVNVTGAPNVNVTNPASAPVLALNVNDPGRIAYQQRASSASSFVTFGPVPVNHRLVVEHVSGILTYTAAPSFSAITVLGTGTRFSTFSTPAASVIAPPGPEAASFFDQPVKFYVDQNQIFSIVALSSLSPNIDTTVTGYLLDCRVAQCAAIASF